MEVQIDVLTGRALGICGWEGQVRQVRVTKQ